MNAPHHAPHHLVPQVEPFFFDVDPGTRFCLYHAPNPMLPPRGAILYVHPFAEELNLSRRMAAQQARLFAARGYAVLQIDLFGCGDSCGDFGAGRWPLWQRDLDVAADWLAERHAGPLAVWGLRLGALLAMDLAARREVERLILWQPLIRGRTCIAQFLRQASVSPANPASLRTELAARGRIEVGGLELDLALARAIEACDAIDLAVTARTVHWFSSAAMPRRLAAHWQQRGIALDYHAAGILPFWSDPAHPECPSLLAATARAFDYAVPALR